jgi:hypothetical protein
MLRITGTTTIFGSQNASLNKSIAGLSNWSYPEYHCALDLPICKVSRIFGPE